MATRPRLLIYATLTLTTLFLPPAFAQDDGDGIDEARSSEAAIKAAQGELPVDPERPAHLQDFTKGKGALVADGTPWMMGPIGIVGFKNRRTGGDQVRVIGTVKDSPADGKVKPGDVVLGLNGRRFRASEDINRVVGNTIIKAEAEPGGGTITLHMWRDKNWSARMEEQNQASMDLDEVMKEVMSDTDIYEWKSEEQRAEAVNEMRLGKYPVDPETFDVEVKLAYMGTYSDTSPWSCPVAKKVRDNALKVIARRMARMPKDDGGRFGGCVWSDVLALVASGEPRYVELAKKWVHTQKFTQDMNRPVKLGDADGRAWTSGFNYLERAIYLDATGDEYVKARVRLEAVNAALGQNGGGAWGHGFSWPGGNFGRLHGMLSNNYGAVNNAGSRIFMLLALAKKNGIEHPELDAAIARSCRFFGSYVDKGAVPYGYHGAVEKFDDNNGRHYGVGYAFYALGDWYKAKYFAMTSAHTSFTRGDGHGSRTFWYYSPLAAQMTGPKPVQAHMRNMRYFYTLSRRHDGSFIFLADWGIGGEGMRNPTAYVTLYYLAPLKQLMITGKDADPRVHMTDKEYDELMFSARPQFGDPLLIKQAGKTMQERSSDELIEMLGHFLPRTRSRLVKELGKRYAAGEKDIPAKVVPLLKSDEPRLRNGACRTLAACGEDVVLANMSKIADLLDDEHEIGRKAAVGAIGRATKPGNKTRDLAALHAAADDFDGMTTDNANLRSLAKHLLLGGESSQNLMKTSPFTAGYDDDLVRKALEKIVTMDPDAAICSEWDKQSVLKLAGPLTYVAFERQVNGKMFMGYRERGSRNLLNKFNYREGIEGEQSALIRRVRVDRDTRMKYRTFNSFGGVKGPPGRYRFLLDALRALQFEFPTKTVNRGEEKIPLNKIIAEIEKDTTTPDPRSIKADVQPVFMAELAAAGDLRAQVKWCRAELEDQDRKNYIRKQLAMRWLAGKFGVKAMPLITPYLGFDFWSVDEEARRVAVELVKQGGGDRLIELFKVAQAKDAGMYGFGNVNAAAMLMVLGEAKYKPALPIAKASLKHRDKAVRKAAVQAVHAIGGDAALSIVFAFLRQAKESADLMGVEMALLSRKDNPVFVAKASRAMRTLLPRCEPQQRRSLAWVLGKLGGPENLMALARAAATTTDKKDRNEIARALALSPDRAATETMLKLLRANDAVRDAVAPLFVHRMLGPKGWNEVSDTERMRIAAMVLEEKFDKGMIRTLGSIHTQASMQLLYEILEVKPELAKNAIVDCAEGMKNPSKGEAAMAKKALSAVIEYLEVTYLRKGYPSVGGKWARYIFFTNKALQKRAGQALVKFAAPKKESGALIDQVDFEL